jgi:uncharacterized protein YndB with AHSA1/START domain
MSIDADPIERRVFIAASPDTVFKYLVDPTLMTRWIGHPSFVTASEGDTFSLKFTFGEGHTAAGVFIEVSTPHRVAFSFGWEGVDGFPPGTSIVEIDLSPHDGGTVVHLRHSGFPESIQPKFSAANHGLRWSMYLSQLADAVDHDGAA